MNIRVEETQDATVIYLNGDLNLPGAPVVREAIRRVLGEGKEKKRLIIDLRDVRFVDSSGMAALVEALKLSRDQDVELVLTRPSRSVQEVMQLSKLIEIFHVSDTLP